MLLAIGIALAAAAAWWLRAPAAGDRAHGFDDALARRVMESYADLLYAMYSDSVDLAVGLDRVIEEFLAAPTEAGLQEARQAWRDARPFYLQTEVARFYEGPIDGGTTPPERFLNAWPLDEAYLDYVEGDPDAGLINDPAGFPVLDAEAIRSANERGGEANVATGWHAIEFLLWGQDTVLGPGGGQRSHLDYVPGGGTAKSEVRRAAVLRVLTRALVEDLTFVRDQWAPGDPNDYRTWFLASTPRKALGKIMSGVATLAFGEMRGERLVVPYVTKDRENEHSCFSDTTHLDHPSDLRGIENVWEGRYSSSSGRHDFSGTGLRVLAETSDPRLAEGVTRSIAEAMKALSDPALDPFETAIQGVDSDRGRVEVRIAVKALASLTHDLFDIASRMDVPLNTSLPQQR